MPILVMGKKWIGLTLPLGTINDPRFAARHREARKAASKVLRDRRLSKAAKVAAGKSLAAPFTEDNHRPNGPDDV